MAKAKGKDAKGAGATGDAAGKKDKKGKKGKKGAAGATASTGRPLSVAAHPRARSHVRTAKGLGGLLGFVVAAYLSTKASVPLADVGERSLLAGLGGYMLGWVCSVTVWRQLMLAELKVAAEEYARRRAAHDE